MKCHEKTKMLEGHQGKIQGLSITPDGQYILSGGSDRSVKLWDGATGECLKTFEGHDGGSGFWVHDVSVSSNGRWILSLSNKVQAWKLSAKRIRRLFWGVLVERPKFVINDESISSGCMVLAPGGRRLFVTIDGERKVGLYRVNNGRLIRTFEMDGQMVSSMALAQSSSVLAVGTAGGTIALFDLFG